MALEKLRQAGGRARLLAALLLAVCLLAAGGVWAAGAPVRELVIRDWQTGEICLRHPVNPGDVVYFGWIHSLEKIPWNEYYHISSHNTLILDAITFPAFGAGIPENRGAKCTVEDGLIRMWEIDEEFPQLVWMNSPTATQELRVNDEPITRGDALPHHRRLVLAVERRSLFGQ